MANIKFSQFPTASVLTGSETFVGLQSSANTQFPVSLLTTSGPVATALASKQNTLTAGTNISIVGNVISATGVGVTSVGVSTANGFAGTVANPTTTPSITLTTSVTGLIKGNGTALQAAVSGTDYAPGTSGLITGILKSTTTTGALSIAVAADFPTLNQNTTGTASNVTGVVALTNGGTGQTTKTAAYNALSPTTTKGDIEVHDGTNVIRVAVGTNGTVLTADSSQASGVRWASVTGTGTVTSVDMTVPSFLSVSGGPITNAGTLAVSLSGTALPAINGGTAQTTYALGDILYASATNTLSKLAGQTTTTRNFLRQTGTGSASAAPAWDTVTKADVGLSAVENTALSTWPGTANITTVGIIATGTWSGTAIAVNKGGTGLTAGVSGGVLGFTATGTVASSSLLASNAIVLGGGAGATPLTVAGITTDGGARINLGVTGVSAGSLSFANATSGSIVISPTTGALGSTVLTLPATTGTISTLDTLVDTVSATTYNFVAADIGRHKVFTNASGCSATVPAGLGATWNVTFAKAAGAGTLTFVQSGTTLINQSGSLVMSATNGSGAIIPTSTANTYTLEGIFGSSGAVTSVFGRTGAVTAQASDYTFAQIGSTPTTLSGYGITNGQVGIQFQNASSNLGTSGTADTLNFTGAGVSTARVGNTVTVTVSGGGSGAPVVENIPTGSAYTLVTGDANKIKRGVDTNPQTINITTAFNGLAVTIEWPSASGAITLDANAGVNLNGLGDGVNIVLADTGGAVNLIPTGTNTWDVVGAVGNLVAADITDSTTVGRSILTAANAAAVRTAAGVVIGTDVQAQDATLQALAGLTIAANSLTIGTGTDAFSQTTFAANTFPGRSSTGNLVAKPMTDFGYSLVDDTDAATARTTLGLVIGTNVQAADATLTALAGLTIAANSLTIGTGADAFSQTTFAANTFPARASTGSLDAKVITDFGLSLVDDSSASAARTTLGLVIGTDVQAQNSYLAKISAATPRQITTSTTLIATDVDCTIRVSNGSPIVLTLADDATLTPVVGKSVITVFIEGAGVPTFAAGTATLLGSPRAGLAQNDIIVLVHTGIANTWVYA